MPAPLFLIQKQFLCHKKGWGAPDCRTHLIRDDYATAIEAATGSGGGRSTRVNQQGCLKVRILPSNAQAQLTWDASDAWFGLALTPELITLLAPSSDFEATLEGNQRLLEELIRFQRSDEIPSDARDGMQALFTWWQQHPRITPEQSLVFKRTVQRLIRTQLDPKRAPEGHQQLRSGLLAPRSEGNRQTPAVELDPRVYTTLEVAKIVNYHDSTIRRQAENAWAKANEIGPCPLKQGSEWYLVAAPKDGGGQKCGWKLQKRLAPEEH